MEFTELSAVLAARALPIELRHIVWRYCVPPEPPPLPSFAPSTLNCDETFANAQPLFLGIPADCSVLYVCPICWKLKAGIWAPTGVTAHWWLDAMHALCDRCVSWIVVCTDCHRTSMQCMRCIEEPE